MYHCHIQICLIGGQQEIFEVVRKMPPLEHFSHTFVESARPDEALLAQSDLILADIQEMNAGETLSALTHSKKAGAELVLLAGKELAQTLADASSEIKDIWTLPMSEGGARFRFLRWQQAYRQRRDCWEAKYFLDTCINASPNMIWYKDKDGFYEMFNDSFCKAAHETREQVEGHKRSYVWDVGREEHPDSGESESKVVCRRVSYMSEENAHTDGGETQLTTYESPLLDLDGGVMGTVSIGVNMPRGQEIAEKNRTLEMQFSTKDREITYQEQIFEVLSTLLSDHIDDVYMMLDETGKKAEFISPNTERVLGISWKILMDDLEQVGRATYISGEEIGYKDLVELKPGMALEPMETERIDKKTGERKWFRESVYCVSVQGRKKIIVYISDRTRERMNQNSLAEALEMAQVANKAKSTFLGNVSHDIRTPMNAIMGLVALLKEEADNADHVREYAQKISAASQHLLGLINDVLDMNKIESGGVVLNVSELSLAEIIEEINTIIRPQARAKDQSFDIFTDSLTSEHLMGDKLRINQILINILSNAVKYTQEGGRICMNIKELPPVTPNYGRIQFTVEDNGQGMSEDYLEVIFDPFTRERNAAGSKIQGTGLGMAITKNLVDLMGGTIKVTSKPDEGSTFTVELELRIQEQKADPEFWSRHGVTRMIVADDDEDICQDIIKKMSGTGVLVHYATNGAQAIDMIRKARVAEAPYDLILLDWKMPGLDGLSTARLIRRNYSEKVPILLFTAYDWVEIEEEALEVGIKHFLPKPFFMSNFKEAIQRMMGAEKKAAPAAHSESVISGKHILVVDDIEVNRMILVKILSTMGASCDVAEDGQKALEKFEQSQPGEYDIICMDIQMPNMNGYESTRAIRSSSHPSAQSIAIIAMTANAFVDDVRESLKAGMDAHVAKPIVLDQLEGTFREVLERRSKKMCNIGD